MGAVEPSNAWSDSERERLKACAKALMFADPALMPRLGRFALVRLLGRGAHGAVYEANDLERGGRVALKTLRRPDAISVEAFKREFRVLAEIANENLVELYELFASGDEWYFTMELVEGTDFVSYVHPGAPAAAGDAFARLRSALVSLAIAVRAIHRAGKLHCDLKPSNVQVTAEGRVVVLDYGLVSAGRAHGAARDPAGGGGPYGTPEYMAPELFGGFAPTPASDVYAIGAMLFVALTGRLPFDGRGDATLSLKQARDAPSPRELAREVPSDLEALCNSMLARDPRRRPTIDGILEQLGGGAVAAGLLADAERATPSLLGRERELGVLRAALADAHGERPVALFVSGASGIGKTALIEQFTASLEPRTLVLAGRCYEHEALPYKAFDGIVGALARWLQARPEEQARALAPADVAALLRVFPALARVPAFRARAGESVSVDRQELRQQAFAALKQLFWKLSQPEPVVLVIDDLQWGDLDSARLLLELLGGPSAPRLLVIGCCRGGDEQRGEFMPALSASPAPEHARWEHRTLELGPLDETTCARLALQLLPRDFRDADRVCARIARDAAGLPIFVRELARHFESTGADATASPPLTDLIEARIAALPEDSQTALALLALAARPVAARVVAYALARERWRRALRVLQVAGLARSDGSGALLTYHDRVRELSAARVPVAERAGLHAALARAYEREPDAEPEWLIEHWRAAEEPARALEYAIVAAGAAGQKLAFNRAASLYRTALELIDAADARVLSLRELFADALANAGRAGDAADAFMLAAERAGDDVSFSLRCKAMQQRLRSNVPEGGLALSVQLLEEVGIAYPYSGVAPIMSWLRTRAMVAWRSVARAAATPRGDAERNKRRLEVLGALFREYSVFDPARGLSFQLLFHAEALRAGNAEGTFVAAAWEAYNRAFVAGTRGTRRNAETLARLECEADRLRTPYARATVALMRAACALFEGNYSEVEAAAARAEESFGTHCVGTLWEESVGCALRYTAMEITGPIRKLGESVPALARRAVERGDRFSDAILATPMTLALLANDEADSARAFIEARCELAPPYAEFPHLMLETRLIDCLRYRGDAMAAWQRCEQSFRLYSRGLYSRIELLRVMAHHQRARCAVAAAASSGDCRLLRIAEKEARRVLGVHRPESPALAAATRAAIAAQCGDVQRAIEQLQTALRAAESAGIWAYHACFRWQLARLTEGASFEPCSTEADAALRRDGIVNPARWVEIYAPGFGTSACVA